MNPFRNRKSGNGNPPPKAGAPDFFPSGPDFLACFEDGGVKVIGDEPDNNDYDPDPSEGAHISKAKIGCESSSCDASIEWPTIVWLAVKPIEKPRAGNRHARFE